MIEIPTRYYERVRYAGPKAVMDRLCKGARTIGFTIDRAELDSLRPDGLAVAVAVRRVDLIVKVELGPHAAGLPKKGQHVLAARILREAMAEAMDGFRHAPLMPAKPSRRDRTHATWVPVWDKQRLVPTGLLIYADDNDDATQQLNALEAILEMSPELLTISPPPGWDGFGDPR